MWIYYPPNQNLFLYSHIELNQYLKIYLQPWLNVNPRIFHQLYIHIFHKIPSKIIDHPRLACPCSSWPIQTSTSSTRASCKTQAVWAYGQYLSKYGTKTWRIVPRTRATCLSWKNLLFIWGPSARWRYCHTLGVECRAYLLTPTTRSSWSNLLCFPTKSLTFSTFTWCYADLGWFELERRLECFVFKSWYIRQYHWAFLYYIAAFATSFPNP